MPIRIPARRCRPGFTLVELMVVAAIIAVLLVATLPAVRSMMSSSAQAQTENAVRGMLTSARAYAMKNGIVAGVRFQGDGHMVMIYARNHADMQSPDSMVSGEIYDMKAVEHVAPGRLSDPWRVTAWDVGAVRASPSRRFRDSGQMGVTWCGPSGSGYDAATEWLDTEHEWFVYPVVLFSPMGKPILSECKFSGSSSSPWYPTLGGAFGNAVDTESNDNPIPGHSSLKFTNQPAIVGWRSTSYKGSGSHNVPVEAPTVTRALRLFNYNEFRIYDSTKFPNDEPTRFEALHVIHSTAIDLRIDQNTGMVIRMEPFRDIEANN